MNPTLTPYATATPAAMASPHAAAQSIANDYGVANGVGYHHDSATARRFSTGVFGAGRHDTPPIWRHPHWR